jgi:hypothetical protein
MGRAVLILLRFEVPYRDIVEPPADDAQVSRPGRFQP